MASRRTDIASEFEREFRITSEEKSTPQTGVVANFSSLKNDMGKLVKFMKSKEYIKMSEKEKKRFQESLGSDFMDAFDFILSKFRKTEYGYEQYAGDEILDKYHRAVAQKWNNKSTKKTEKQVTENEVNSKFESYQRRKQEAEEARLEFLSKNLIKSANDHGDDDDDDDDDLIESMIMSNIYMGQANDNVDDYRHMLEQQRMDAIHTTITSGNKATISELPDTDDD